MPSEKRKAKKAQYFKAAKRSKNYEAGKILKEGMKGFLLTCNNREKDAVREGYSLLNEYADKLFGSEQRITDNKDVESNGEEQDDIDDALDKEKKNLRAESEKKPSERRFQQVESGANNCIFIKTLLNSPDQLVDEIVKDLQESQAQKCRFILRLLPILGTCKAYEKNIEDLAKDLISHSLSDTKGPSSYSVLFKTRNTNQISRDDVFRIVGGVMREVPGPWKVDLEKPDVSIVVEIIRNVCCIGLVKDYFSRKKYNLIELVSKETHIIKPTE